MGTIAYYYANGAIPGLLGNSGGIGNSDTSIYLQSVPSGYPQQFPFKLRLDPRTPSEEVVKIVGGAGTSAQPWIVGTAPGVASTAGRGWDGTTATSHSQGSAVEHGLSQEDLALARVHEASDSTGTPADGWMAASAALPHGLPAAAWQTASFAALREVVMPNSSSSSVNWANISQQYAHLMLVVRAHSTDTSNQADEVTCTINGDSGARYSLLSLSSLLFNGTQTGPNVFNFVSQSGWSTFLAVPSSQVGDPSNPGGGFAIIPGYASTAAQKMALAFSGWYSSGNMSQKYRACFYHPPNPQLGITSITLTLSSGKFLAGSFLGLYGFG
jgi:hypothetical protein